MRSRWWLVVVLCASTGVAGAADKKDDSRTWRKRWWASVALVAAANVADIHSSVGLPEANPLLRNNQGGLNIRTSVVVKSAASGGFVLLEFILLKKLKHERLEKPFTVINGVAAGAVAATALRNYGISRPDQSPSQP